MMHSAQSQPDRADGRGDLPGFRSSHWCTAMGAGIMLYERGTPDVGLASAGQGAGAGRGTAFTDPAGMTQFENSQLLAGIVPNFGNFTFSRNGAVADLLEPIVRAMHREQVLPVALDSMRRHDPGCAGPESSA